MTKSRFKTIKQPDPPPVVSTFENFSNVKIQAFLANRKAFLRELDRNVTALLKTPHISADVQAPQADVLDLDRELTDVSYVLEDRLATPDHDDASATELQGNLAAQCAKLISDNERINRRLGEAMDDCRHKETQEAFSPIEIAALGIALPAAVKTVIETALGERSPWIAPVVELSAAIGTGIAFHKQISAAWKAVARTLCGSVKVAKDSFLLYYMKETGREKIEVTGNLFSATARTVTRYLSEARPRLTKAIRRIIARNPRL